MKILLSLILMIFMIACTKEATQTSIKSGGSSSSATGNLALYNKLGQNNGVNGFPNSAGTPAYPVKPLSPETAKNDDQTQTLIKVGAIGAGGLLTTFLAYKLFTGVFKNNKPTINPKPDTGLMHLQKQNGNIYHLNPDGKWDLVSQFENSTSEPVKKMGFFDSLKERITEKKEELDRKNEEKKAEAEMKKMVKYEQDKAKSKSELLETLKVFENGRGLNKELKPCCTDNLNYQLALFEKDFLPDKGKSDVIESESKKIKIKREPGTERTEKKQEIAANPAEEQGSPSDKRIKLSEEKKKQLKEKLSASSSVVKKL